MSKGYIPSLDGIRAISVLLVVVSHAGFDNVVPGGLGVTIFFFLSGLLITTLLLQEFQKIEKIDYPFFFLRRFYRLFPPLIISLIVANILAYYNLVSGGVSLEGILYQVFYLANYSAIYSWSGVTPEGLDILWSLAVEEHFYLVFPLLLGLCLNRLTKNNIAIILFVLCCCVLLWRANLFILHDSPIIRIYRATDTRIDSILFGCIIALTWNPIYKKQHKHVSKKAICLITLAMILLLSTLLIRDENFRQTLRYTLQGLALIPLFYYSIIMSNSYIFRFLNWTWLRKLGQFSYCIYLIHYVVIDFLKKQQIAESMIQILLLTMFISICFAFLVDKYIDSYFRVLRAKLRR